jgi:hypothetical protein
LSGLQTITVDTASLYIPSNTVLDLGGNALAAPSSSCPPGTGLVVGTYKTNSLTGPQQLAGLGGLSAAANSSMGATVLFVAPNSGITYGLAAGVYCALNNIYLDGQPSNTLGTGAQALGSQWIMITAFANSTGAINISHPLIGAWGTAANPTYTGTMTCYDPNTVTVNSGLQNGVITLSGTCTASQLVYVDGATRFTMRNIRMSAAYSSSTTVVRTQRVMDSDFMDLSVDNTLATNLAFTCFIGTGLTFDNIRLTANGGTTSMYGLVLYNTVFSTVTNLQAHGMKNAGLALLQSFECTVMDVMITDCDSGGINTGGVWAATGTRNIVGNNIMTLGATGYAFNMGGLSGGPPTRYNQFWNVVSKNGASSNGINIASSASGNFFGGQLDRGVTSNSNLGNTDVGVFNCVKQSSNSNGFMAFSVHNATLTAVDFPATRMMAFSNLGDTQVYANVYGIDGVVRRASVTIS